jgi:hypothetical protein
MKTTSRFAVASFLVIAAAGCSSATSTTPTDDSAAPATKPAAATPADTTPGAAAAPATATAGAYRWEVHKATNLKFELPTSWAMEQSGDVLLAKTPTPAVVIEFVAATGGLEAKNDEKAMLAAVASSLKGARFTSRLKAVQQHGLKGVVATGTGTRDGVQIEWFTAALGDGAGHAMLTLGMYRPTAPTAYKEQLLRVINSIQPAR